MTRPQPPPFPVLDPAVVQVFLGALLAENLVLPDPWTVLPPEHLHLGLPWPRP
ncbi:MAG TPA: hypothetical protein VNO19_09760 [Gemmatimonadales bacterium]|nr:hypothetical protein [Gemmatimonadales bacterium]